MIISPCPTSFLVVESIHDFTLELTYPITWNKSKYSRGKEGSITLLSALPRMAEVMSHRKGEMLSNLPVSIMDVSSSVLHPVKCNYDSTIPEHYKGTSEFSLHRTSKITYIINITWGYRHSV